MTRAELDAYDNEPIDRGDNLYYACPLPACSDKPIDNLHRKLGVSTTTGMWHCFRCGAKGIFRQGRRKQTKKTSKFAL